MFIRLWQFIFLVVASILAGVGSIRANLKTSSIELKSSEVERLIEQELGAKFRKIDMKEIYLAGPNKTVQTV